MDLSPLVPCDAAFQSVRVAGVVKESWSISLARMLIADRSTTRLARRGRASRVAEEVGIHTPKETVELPRGDV